MEPNFSSGGNLIPGSSYSFQSLQNSSQMHPQFYPHPTQNQSHQQMHDSYAHQQISAFHAAVKNSSPSEDISTDPSMVEDGSHDLNPNPNPNSKGGTGSKEASWHRMKWTGAMVKLLITAVSYIDEDFTSPMLKKKGKWKLISRVLSERGGSHVSPQQCEDKFNDLNKRYKRLTDILGRGRSCKVVENPALLDYLQDVSDKLKEEAKKILGSKHLFYEEMCSYHNCNRVNLPPDGSLRKALHLAFGDFEEAEPSGGDTNEDNEEDVCLGSTNIFSEGDPQSSGRGEGSLVRIREEGLKIQAQMLEIERQRLKWNRFSEKKERELERMRLENERMRMDNQRLELEIRKKELDLECRKRRHC